MHAVIAGRLAQLSPGAHELVGLAATVGRDFTVDILRKASGTDADSLTDELDELWQRRIVRATPQQSASNPVDISTSEPFTTGLTVLTSRTTRFVTLPTPNSAR